MLTTLYRYRDISIYGKGFANEWNSHTIFEVKWDANRDPDRSLKEKGNSLKAPVRGGKTQRCVHASKQKIANLGRIYYNF